MIFTPKNNPHLAKYGIACFEVSDNAVQLGQVTIDGKNADFSPFGVSLTATQLVHIARFMMSKVDAI